MSITTADTKTKIFLTGATGYIGGAVLERLIQHPDSQNFEITVLVRNEQKAEKLRKLDLNLEFQSRVSLNVVIGSLGGGNKSYEGLTTVEELVADADVVFHTADSDDLGAVKCMLRGSKRKFEKTGKRQIFIHTSGTGLFADDAAGLKTTNKIWDDSNPNDIEHNLPASAVHRNVDLELINADGDNNGPGGEGYVKTYIVVPSVIYGLATGKLSSVDFGISNGFSIMLPMLMNVALKRGEVGIVGLGVNVWPNVHIDDVADLYIVLYDTIRRDGENVGHGREGYYFGIADEHTFYEFGKELARVLVQFGKAKNLEPTSFTPEEIQKNFNGSNYLGSNSRGIANRSKSIGWKPTKFKKDLIESVKYEVEEIMRTGYVVDIALPYDT